MLRHLTLALLARSFVGSMLADAPEVSFRNDVMAVLAKGGCSSGPCHGNRNGKGGFKLSLRGEDPVADYQTLVSDAAGRRFDRMVAANSLLLLKPTAQVAHEGRLRFETNSVEYKILERWIEGGLCNDLETAPRLVALEVSPTEAFLIEPETSVQIRAVGKYSDGSSKDVTSLAVYEPVVPIVDISHDGKVTARQRGESTILVRYLERQEPVSLAFIASRPDFAWTHPKPNNFIDEFVYERLRKLRLNSSEICSDAVFVRRVWLDLLGFVPEAGAARQFVGDTAVDKRDRLVKELLERREFAEYWGLKWADLFRCEERALDRKGVQAFQQWIVSRIADHTPLDEFSREILCARGSTYVNPAANWFRSHRTPIERSESIAQVFLGTRLQCAQCHNHPYERWTQADYHDWTALFSRLDYKIVENLRKDPNDKHEFVGEQMVYVSTRGDHKNPRTGRPAVPRFLGSSSALASDELDPLVALGKWMTDPQHPLFTRAQANRIWFHLMGRGLVDPVDDFRTTNPATHPELLNALASELIKAQFDVRHLIRLIINSRTYQSSSEPADKTDDDTSNYSHNIPRRLAAEQLLDSQSLVAGVPLEFAGWPTGTRAAQLPGVSAQPRRGRKPMGDLDRFLQTFGKPPRQLPTECERSCEPAMGQAFELISGPAVQNLISQPDNRLGALLDSGRSTRDLIEDLYWTALGRSPSKEEMEVLRIHFENADCPRVALEDILWGLLNAKEFVLRY